MAKLWIYFVSCLVIGVYSASILDFIAGTKGREENEGLRNCVCNGPSCICCLDFNISLVDLGGPGCVRMTYLSPEEGIDLNVSYGEDLIHSERVKGPDPEPTCLNLLSSFAQICARFNELLPTDSGLRGCIQFEPTILGEPQIEFPMGCFRMGPEGMKVVDPPPVEQEKEKPVEAAQSEAKPDKAPGTPEESENEEIVAGLNADDILAVVNDTANKGIALITDWLGIGPESAKNSTVEVETTTAKQE
ncbi:unnamed protein product [Hermetia illucens]|uniref:DUF4773 domain-containing protein n=1 Tax=Hermetia illucens TaxID=343691 RepID=A0A7R8UA24_HERIL|nr:uncharacterized protein LOC119661151 [Hermetia illucens]CAD7076910.1 unnamed protein product [Hermetia illucens]